MAPALHDFNLEAPVTAAEFAAAMAGLGPFERQAHIAVAVSGGADSMALLHLVRQWNRRTGGRLTVLTVDHGLRAVSGVEARQVGAWARALGLDHQVLTWTGPRPSAGIQEAARQARYGLLTDWCRVNGVLHLLIAHQRDDQAETVMIRLLNGSGFDGLAGMAPVIVRHGVRILRPLLAFPRRRLRATLTRADVPWLDDPSNENMAFERIRMRRFLGAGPSGEEACGWTDLLIRLAGVMARLRTVRARVLDRWLAGSVAVYDAGYAAMRYDDWSAAAPDIAAQALSRVLLCVSGRLYPPGRDPLDRLTRALLAKPRQGGTLAGCRITFSRGLLLISREAPRGGADPEERVLAPGAALVWDRRFYVRRAGDGASRGATVSVRRLGRDGWEALGDAVDPDRSALVPPVVRPTLPSAWCGGRPVFVPHIGFTAPDMPHLAENVRFRFAPAHPLTPVPFGLANS
jgi:tRNA(Ile)-lysidine synthase